MNPRPILVGALLLSGAFDAAGGVWALLDWRGAARFVGGVIPDWDVQRQAVEHGLADAALRQLWSNLGTALLALAAVQIVAAFWTAGGRPAGAALSRLVGWALIAAGGLMATLGGQPSSLLTEATRGLGLLALSVWTRNASGTGTSSD